MALRGADYVQRTEALRRILKSYRVLTGLTQDQLAEQLGVVQSLVSKVESRERRLDLLELQEYLKPLGRTVQDVLADLERIAPSPRDVSVESLTRDAIEAAIETDQRR
ncbi:helix-turn-helix transcriptional regulator [Gordonia sp. MP11Mi]|uniref:HTH cro/C1-type domain-containing protein n=1 Tax=Gordonia sp. MP11Mi TaxID=3022769 RepID=A0AA97GVD4_9ACTN